MHSELYQCTVLVVKKFIIILGLVRGLMMYLNWAIDLSFMYVDWAMHSYKSKVLPTQINFIFDSVKGTSQTTEAPRWPP